SLLSSQPANHPARNEDARIACCASDSVLYTKLGSLRRSNIELRAKTSRQVSAIADGRAALLHSAINRAAGSQRDRTHHSKYLLANCRNVGQFGPGVCPSACWRNARSPSINAVSIGGNSFVPRPRFPS